MRPSVFFQYPVRQQARDRRAFSARRPTLFFAICFTLLTVTVPPILYYTAIATRAPLPTGPTPADPTALTPKAADILADIRSRWSWRLVPPEWIIKPEAGDELIPAEVTWLKVEGRARLFVIASVYFLSAGFLYRRQRRAAASNERAELERYAAGETAA